MPRRFACRSRGYLRTVDRGVLRFATSDIIMFLLRQAARASRTVAHSSKRLTSAPIRVSARAYGSKAHRSSSDAPWAIVSVGVFGPALAYVLTMENKDLAHATHEETKEPKEKDDDRQEEQEDVKETEEPKEDAQEADEHKEDAQEANEPKEDAKEAEEPKEDAKETEEPKEDAKDTKEPGKPEEDTKEPQESEETKEEPKEEQK